MKRLVEGQGIEKLIFGKYNFGDDILKSSSGGDTQSPQEKKKSLQEDEDDVPLQMIVED